LKAAELAVGVPGVGVAGYLKGSEHAASAQRDKDKTKVTFEGPAVAFPLAGAMPLVFAGFLCFSANCFNYGVTIRSILFRMDRRRKYLIYLRRR
jgi:hypothetical protein